MTSLESAKLYKGTVIRRFLVDRLAMGYDESLICDEFRSIFGADLPRTELEIIVRDCNGEILAREAELSAVVSSSNFLSQVIDLKNEVSEVRRHALESNDLKNYGKLVDSTLHSLEVFLKTTESFQKKAQRSVTLVQQNNFFAFEELARAGIIELKDVNELKRLLGGGVKEFAKVVDVQGEQAQVCEKTVGE